MTTSPHLTTDHDEIRRWIQAHHGAPARDTTGALRIDSLGVTSGLEHLSWTDWFATFDRQGLALCYPEPHVRGGNSAWFELVPRARTVHGAGPGLPGRRLRGFGPLKAGRRAVDSPVT